MIFFYQTIWLDILLPHLLDQDCHFFKISIVSHFPSFILFVVYYSLKYFSILDMSDNYPTLILPHTVGNLMQYHTAHWKKKAESACILEFFFPYVPVSQSLPAGHLMGYCCTFSSNVGNSVDHWTSWWGILDITLSKFGDSQSQTIHRVSKDVSILHLIQTFFSKHWIPVTRQLFTSPDISPYNFVLFSEIKGVINFIQFR